MPKRAREFDENEESDLTKRKILNDNELTLCNEFCMALFRSSSLKDFSRREHDPIEKAIIVGITVSALKKLLLLFHNLNSNTVITQENVWTRKLYV